MNIDIASNFEPDWETPLVELDEISERVGGKVYAKIEIYNPTGSHKDRGVGES